MSRSVIALGGPPGSGKTTAARLLAERVGRPLALAGELFRAEATRRGMDLGAFSALAEADPTIDRSLDETMLDRARHGYLLEGRLAGSLCRRRGMPVESLSVVAPEAVRAARIARRDGVDATTALALLRERERSERRRYQSYYGIDLDSDRPDFVVDSSSLSPDAVVRRLEEYLRSRAWEPWEG